MDMSGIFILNFGGEDHQWVMFEQILQSGNFGSVGKLWRSPVSIYGYVYIYIWLYVDVHIYIYTYTYMSKYVSIYMDAPHLHQCSHRSIKSVAGCSYAKHDHARRRPSWEQSADFLQFMEDWTWHTLQSMAIHNNNNTIVSTITMIVLLSNTLVQSLVVHN